MRRPRAAYIGGLRLGRSILHAPSHIGAILPEQRTALLSCLAGIRHALEARHRVQLDFSRTRVMRPGGMLLLLSNLQTLARRYAGRIVLCCPDRSIAGQLLRHVGLPSGIELRAPNCAPCAQTVVGWEYLTGARADGQKLGALIERYRAMPDVVIPEGLYDVLAEALTNVVHHAYPVSQATPPRGWWMFANRSTPTDAQPGSLYIAIYDSGIGIPESMNRRLLTGEWLVDKTDHVFRLMGLRHGRRRLNALLLERAVTQPRSSTGQPNRGRGLPEMREFVRATAGASLFILSGGALYTRTHHGQVNVVESTASIEQDRIPGTLIVWNLPLHRNTMEPPA